MVVLDEVVYERPHPTSDVADVATGAEGGVIGDDCRGMESGKIRQTQREDLEMKKRMTWLQLCLNTTGVRLEYTAG